MTAILRNTTWPRRALLALISATYCAAGLWLGWTLATHLPDTIATRALAFLGAFTAAYWAGIAALDLAHTVATPKEHHMSAFTDRLHALLSRLGSVSHEDVAKVEAELEAKVHPLVTEVRDELKADLTTVEQQLKVQLADLEAKVESLLGKTTPPAAS